MYVGIYRCWYYIDDEKVIYHMISITSCNVNTHRPHLLKYFINYIKPPLFLIQNYINSVRVW